MLKLLFLALFQVHRMWIHAKNCLFLGNVEIKHYNSFRERDTYTHTPCKQKSMSHTWFCTNGTLRNMKALAHSIFFLFVS